LSDVELIGSRGTVARTPEEVNSAGPEKAALAAVECRLGRVTDGCGRVATAGYPNDCFTAVGL